MIGRNEETQKILSRLAAELGEHMSPEFTIDQMAVLAEKYGKEDFDKAINDPDSVALLDKVAEPDNKQTLDREILSKYFRQHRDMVRSFSNKLEDPLRDVAQSYFLKGFYGAAMAYAQRGTDITESAGRLQELSDTRKETEGTINNNKAELKSAIRSIAGDMACQTKEVQEIFASIDVGDLSKVSERFPELANLVYSTGTLIKLAEIKRALINKAFLSEFLSVTAARRKNKEIADYEYDPISQAPDTEPAPGEEKPKPEEAWRGQGGATAYHSELYGDVAGGEVVRRARGFVAQALGRGLYELKPKMEALVERAVTNIGRAIAAAVEVSPQTKAALVKPPKVQKIDISDLTEQFADKNEDIQQTSAKKITDRDQVDAEIEALVSAEEKTLYDYAKVASEKVADAGATYQAWANEMSKEINKFQGGRSWEELPETEVMHGGISDKEKYEALPKDLKPADRAFKKRVMDMNWSPLAQLVIEKQQSQPVETDVHETGLTEDWPALAKKRFEDYEGAKQKIVGINSKSNELFGEMEKAKAKKDNFRYNKLQKEFNEQMAQLMEALGELDEFENDTLLFPAPTSLSQATHSKGTKGNPLFYFINMMFNVNVETLQEAKKYVELLSNGKAVVRADVLKREFRQFFVTKLTGILFEAMQRPFHAAVKEKTELLYTDKLLAQVEDEKAAETLENEEVARQNEEMLEQRRKQNETQTQKERDIVKNRREPNLGQPAELGYADLSPEEREENIYGGEGSFHPGRPSEEEK